LTSQPFDSDLVTKASPLENMPTKSVIFDHEAKTDEETIAVFGTYGKTSSWKAWGNIVQDGSDDSEVGRRYSSEDNQCLLRNMLVSVVSTDENTQLLLEMESKTFGSVWLSTKAVIAGGLLMANLL